MTDAETTDVERGRRDWHPQIFLFVAEHGDEDGREGILAFHTLDEAERWLGQSIGSHNDPAEIDLEQEDTRCWSWDDGGWGDGGMGLWAEVRKTRVTQPRRLLRDDRE